MERESDENGVLVNNTQNKGFFIGYFPQNSIFLEKKHWGVGTERPCRKM